FFFSSRRRHTRSKRDWSSDLCSSDLIPPHMMISAHASELWNYVSPQLKDPAGYLARVQEIIASAASETFDVLQLKDGRVFEQNSAIQLIKQRNVGRVWSFREIGRASCRERV